MGLIRSVAPHYPRRYKPGVPVRAQSLAFTFQQQAAGERVPHAPFPIAFIDVNADLDASTADQRRVSHTHHALTFQRGKARAARQKVSGRVVIPQLLIALRRYSYALYQGSIQV
jgi:hypothetical protein